MTQIIKLATRLYECVECGHQARIETNHRGSCYPTCSGKCKQIFSPHTAREIVMRKQTEHKFIKDIGAKNA